MQSPVDFSSFYDEKFYPLMSCEFVGGRVIFVRSNPNLLHNRGPVSREKFLAETCPRAVNEKHLPHSRLQKLPVSPEGKLHKKKHL